VRSEILTPPSRSRRILIIGLLLGWVGACVLLGATLLASHLVTLPAPAAADPVLQRAIAAHRRSDQRNQWMALHILYDQCGCSRRVLDHLLSRPRPANLVERVVVVTDQRAAGAEWIARIPGHGFELDVVTAQELFERYAIETAPLLIVADPRDTVRYVGGYTQRKQATDVRDVAVLAALRRGEPVEPLPTFGCALSRALRTKMDPLGILGK
jgi:hypothetical protein